MLTQPVSSPSANRSARDRSLVYTAPSNPYGESLASSSACFSSRNLMIGAIGPKVSSRLTRMLGSTPSRMVACVRDVLVHLGGDALVVERAQRCVVGEGVAEPEGARGVGEARDELVADGLLDQDALAGRAALS